MRMLLWLAATTVCLAQQVTTLSGTGTAGYAPNQLNQPYGLALGPDRGLYFCDIGNHAVRRLDLLTRQLTTVAGTGRAGYAGDGGLATEAFLNQPYELAFDRNGDLFVVEMRNHTIRRIDHRTQKIQTVAGTGRPGYSGDGGPAVEAELNQPHSLTFDHEGRLLICDIGNQRVRRIDLKTGKIESLTFPGVTLNGPRAITTDSLGRLYLVLREGNAVYEIDPVTYRGSLLAGTGERGYSGDNGPAVQARLNGPKAIVYGRDRALYLADTENHVIRRIDLETRVITTVLGTGQRGDGPDGDPLRCSLNRPHGVTMDRHGALYVGDSEAHKLRVVYPARP